MHFSIILTLLWGKRSVIASFDRVWLKAFPIVSLYTARYWSCTGGIIVNAWSPEATWGRWLSFKLWLVYGITKQGHRHIIIGEVAPIFWGASAHISARYALLADIAASLTRSTAHSVIIASDAGWLFLEGQISQFQCMRKALSVVAEIDREVATDIHH